MDDSLLARLGLIRESPWDPPTVLDGILASPVQTAASAMWNGLISPLRMWAEEKSAAAGPAVKPNAASVRVVCISDTHDLVVADVPDGDLLIHAGDLTNDGTPAALQTQLDWLASLPHRYKVVVGGNHDTWFDAAARAAAAAAAAKAGNTALAAAYRQANGPVFADGVVYLQHSSAELQFPGGRRLTIYGAGNIPRCGPDSFAFQYPRTSPPWKDTIPANTDILVTHAPPRHHLDLGLGCAGILKETWRVRPRLHVFGHVHWAAGRRVLYWDASQRAYEQLMGGYDAAPESTTPAASAGTWFAAVAALPRRLALFTQLVVLGLVASPQTLRAFMPAWLLPASSSPPPPSILINAAQMHGNTGRLGRNVQFVDL